MCATPALRAAQPTHSIPVLTPSVGSQEGMTALEIAKGENNTEMVRHYLLPHIYTPIPLTRTSTRILTLTLTRCSAWRS